MVQSALRMKAKRIFGLEVESGTDAVCWGITLPGKTILNGFRVNLSYVNGLVGLGGNQHEMTRISPIAFESWLIPNVDPDTPSTYDVVFDRFVPKDNDAEVIDYDTASAVTANFWEPGEMNLNLALRLGNQPMRLSHFHKFVSSANGSLWTGQTIEPAADQEALWTPGGPLQVRSKKKVFVAKPAFLMFAAAMPIMDDTVSTIEAPLNETAQLLVRFMRQSLEGAIMHQSGVTGAGASTWFDTASTILQQHLNPDVFEEIAALFESLGEWTVSGEATIDHTVEGRVKIKSISGGRG